MDDFLIIGGGIAGLAAGARLAELGRVTVLEAEAALGYHASGRSAAMYEPSYGAAPVVALNRASGDFFFGGGGNRLLTPRGLLIVGMAGEEEAFARDSAAMAMERLSIGEARALVPVLDPARVAMAGYHQQAWDIDTDRMLQGFAKAIRTAGGRVLTGRRVSAITRGEKGWQVTTGDGAFCARHLVNAAGAWADQVAAMAGVAPIGITPYRRSMARVAAPEGVGHWPMLFGPGETWYAKPDAGALLISPADETPTEPHDAWAEDMTLAEGIARYEERVTEPVTRMLANWAGLRSFAPDRVLVIGPDPADPGFLWMAGQGGYGFQTAPAASQLLADLAGGRASGLDADTRRALSPARFAG